MIKFIKKNILAASLVVLGSYALMAWADTGAVFDTVKRAYFVARSGYTMTIGTASTDAFKLIANSTPVADINRYGITLQSGIQMLYPAAAVITPDTAVPTPSAGNTLTNANTILAAGAPTAAFVMLPAATLSVGKTYRVYNQGSNPLAIVPVTGVINVSGALTPFSCTTIKECECRGITTGVWGCSQK